MPDPSPLSLRFDDKGRLFSPIRKKWLVETPEERVRQEFVHVLVNEYGYALDQMGEELDTAGRGTAQARADLVLWRSAQDKRDRKPPFIVVECKADRVTIGDDDYLQGEMYARQVNAPFYVTHNNRETRYWRVLKDKMPGYRLEIENIPHAKDSDKEIEALLKRLRTFKEKEFADLLHKCHNVIRNGDHLDPADAFDEIAKILFVKVYVERQMKAKKQRKNVFTTEVLDQQLAQDPINDLFEQTKKHFRGDRLFPKESRIKLKPATAREIVRLLEAYNLSETREDVKGIAFERFLGRTFRGENLGQFFTPRVIVEFMIRMVEPREGDVICDPACGSGGFLIRFFSLVRDQILNDLRRDYEAFREATLADASLSDDAKAKRLRDKDEQIQREADQSVEGSRLWTLANRCVYGTDANGRAAQAAKMNMIMHGDGHGGVHHHNGLLNVNGIFEQRFDLILTNPPFGANVDKSAVVTEEDVALDDDVERRYRRVYGNAYAEARERLVEAQDQPIAALFDLGTNADGKLLKQKTEILFIERCLDLLKPGGRLGVVLPEGVFNNPSLQYVRDFCEDRARITAVVSLPQDTFLSTGATVKASLLFVQKYTDDEQARYDALYATARAEVDARHAPEEAERLAAFDERLNALDRTDRDARRTVEAERRAYTRDLADRKAAESRALLKERFPYLVFLYEAERVGINATGETDQNELFPNPHQPPGTDGQTALELFRRFRVDPDAFRLDALPPDEADDEDPDDADDADAAEGPP